jgi:hypothetical protein
MDFSIAEIAGDKAYHINLLLAAEAPGITA